MGCGVSKSSVKVSSCDSESSVGKHEGQHNTHSKSGGKTTKDSGILSCEQNDVLSTSIKQVDSRVSISLDQSKPSKCIRDVGDGKPTKSVAFHIPFEENRLQSTPIYPRRLKKLEGAPCLTEELLKEKQELAEKNRMKELQRKTETTSKHRRDVFKIRELRKLKNTEIQINAKLMATEANHQNHIQNIVLKQKQREQRARRVLENVCNLNNNEEIVYVDETYNTSDSSCEDEKWDDDIEDNTKKAFEEQLVNEDTNSIDNFFQSSSYPMSTNVFK